MKNKNKKGEKKMKTIEVKKCFVCKQELVGTGHNPYPIIQTQFFKSARCCDNCNNEEVIPARILEKYYQDKYGSDMGSKCIINLIHLGWSVEKTLRLFKHKQVA